MSTEASEDVAEVLRTDSSECKADECLRDVDQGVGGWCHHLLETFLASEIRCP